jgi:hypothetical protein
MLLGHDLSKGQACIWLTEGMHLEGQSRAPAKLVTRCGSRSGSGAGANKFSSCVDTLSRFWTVLSQLASEAKRGASECSVADVPSRSSTVSRSFVASMVF